MCAVGWQDLRALQLIFAVQPPKQLPPLLLDCLRYFLHIGQQLQESRRQQQRQEAIILEQQQQAAAAAAVSSSSSLSADRDVPHSEKPANERLKGCVTPEPESASAAVQSPDVAKDLLKTTGDDTSTASDAVNSNDNQPSPPAPDQTADASKPQLADILSESMSSTAEDHDGKTRPEEGKGIGENVFEYSLVYHIGATQ